MHHETSRALDATLSSISEALSEIDTQWQLEELSPRETSDTGKGTVFLRRLVRSTYLRLVVALERNGLAYTLTMLQKEWETVESKGLLEAVFPEGDDEHPYLVATDILWTYVRACRSFTVPSAPVPADLHTARGILLSLAHSAARLEMKIESEGALDRVAESLLMPVFPTLNSNPALTLPVGYRQPDTALPSVSTLIEYKFIDNAKNVSRILDEIQSDIRNYAQEPWQHLIVLTAITRPFLRREPYEEQILREVTSFHSISPLLIQV